MTATIDLAPEALALAPEALAIVREILRAGLPPGARVWAFGSRANGTARRYSDLDLALEADQPIALDLLADIALALSESDLPIKVDLLDLRAIDPGFRELIGPGLIALRL